MGKQRYIEHLWGIDFQYWKSKWVKDAAMLNELGLSYAFMIQHIHDKNKLGLLPTLSESIFRMLALSNLEKTRNSKRSLQRGIQCSRDRLHCWLTATPNR